MLEQLLARRIAEKRQRSTEERLREAQKLEAIGQLTGGLAHDFNNLLGIVLGNLDMVEEALPDPAPAVRRRIDTARSAALRGAEVTRSLLAVARRQPLQIASYDLNALVEEMLPLVRSSVGSSVEVRLQLAPGALTVRMDAAGLSNLALNLSINARDALLRVGGERKLTLRTRRESVVDAPEETLTPGEYALLEVSDTGAGMSAGVRAQAFEPFFTTKERGKGTGLGLSMAYGFAEQLGGTVRIDSTEGVGTTVQVYLPLEAGQAAAGRTQQAVLVVDDDPSQCELARLWLESMGNSVATAHSAEAALEQLATRRFDVLFSDVVMPGGMDGVALAHEATRRQPDLRALLATDHPNIGRGASEVPFQTIAKPYRKNQLARAMVVHE
jgi:nitrogen-specific signal transduction histidine kinase/CheY-like chemotaxis protein